LSKCSNEDDECLLLLLSKVAIDFKAAEADTFPNSAGSGEALVMDVSSGRITAVLGGSGGAIRCRLGGDDDDNVGRGRSLCGGWDGDDPMSSPSEYDDSAGSLLVDDIGWPDPGFFHNLYTL